MAHTNRRGMFRALANEVMRGARELASLRSLSTEISSEAALDDKSQPKAAQAKAADYQVPIDELLGLAVELGLEKRVDDVRALARTSVRLLPGDPGDVHYLGESRFGGIPDLPEDIAWPFWSGQRLRFLAQINLTQLAPLQPMTGELPPEGILWFFSVPEPPVALTPENAAAGRVVFAAKPSTSAGAQPDPGVTEPLGQSIRLSGELVLPREWSGPVEALSLTANERQAWQEMRRKLAELQGISADESSSKLIAVHRLGGYPNEKRGDMPLACELLGRGLTIGAEPPQAHPKAAGLERHLDRWRMLLQLTIDDQLAWDWGRRRRRLYYWVDAEDLAQRDFSRVKAIAQ